jgi:hypothetical protein
MRRTPALALLLMIAPAVLHAQAPRTSDVAGTDTTGAFLDPGAAALMKRAREARLSSDRSLRSYTAIVRSRIAAGLRMPLKDRTLYRQESAARVRWSRDSTTVVQLLAGREQHPGAIHAPQSGFGIDDLFDPSQDRMYFGLTKVERNEKRNPDDGFWIEHPLGAAAERHYRYQSGDTMTIRLQDGRTVRVLELRVIPRRNDPHTLRGMLWVDTESGALVQAAFRLTRTVDILRDMNALDDDDMKDVAKIPGFLKPIEFDMSLLTVEYSLWEMRHWLPRTMRVEGVARAGVVRFPASAELSYQMLDVTTDAQPGTVSESEAIAATLAEWNAADDHRVINRRSSGRDLRVLVPRDSARLLNSELLPRPIWSEAPEFMSENELEKLYDRVAAVASPAKPDLPVTFGWGFREPDMVRYNRVEALSIGARVTVPLPYVRVEGIARLGAGDLRPNLALRAVRENAHRTLELRGYHELMTVEESGAALGFGNSASALLLGRDEGEYYRAIGASLGMAPPSARRHWYDARAYIERQRAVSRNTHIAVPRIWSDSVFRSNIVADAATQVGALLHLRPWWGTDASRAQLGLDLLLQAEAGDFEHGRARLTVRSAVPVGEKLRVGAEAAVGTSTGTVRRQRWFYLGGASTLRGYEPSTIAGTAMARGRLELARTYGFGNLAIFTDWGWAGDRSDIQRVDQRWAVGAGASLLDGLVRVDLARGLRAPRGWRVDMHLDAIL